MKKLSILFSAFILASCSMPTPTPPATTVPTSVMPTVTMTIPTSAQTSVQIALVDAAGEPGPGTFGCGDRIVMVDRLVSTTTPLQTALSELFSVHTHDYGSSGLITALAGSDLHVNSATLTDGIANIALTGHVSMAGTCDSPRIQEQVNRTIRQFSSVREYHITLNGSESEWRCLFDSSGLCH